MTPQPQCISLVSPLEVITAKLVKALEPFAEFPYEDAAYENAPDSKAITGFNDWRMTVGHVRAARAALEKVRIDRLGIEDSVTHYGGVRTDEEIQSMTNQAQPKPEQQRKQLTDEETQRKTWVSLSEAQINEWWGRDNGLEDCDMCNIIDFIKVVGAVDSKLRELNEAPQAKQSDSVEQGEPCGRLESDPEEGHVFIPRVDGDWSMLGKDLYTTPQRKPLDLISATEYADARWSGVDVPVEWIRHFVDGLGIAPQAKPADIQNPPSETVVQTFTGLPMRKLRELLSGGWAVNGVSFERIEEDGNVRRGAVTLGGMVLWWNHAPTAQPTVPEGWTQVPIEPTREMLDAAWKFGGGNEAPDPYYAYKLMLKAATQAKQAPTADAATVGGLHASISILSHLVDNLRKLLVEVEDICGRDDRGAPFEDGESALIDKVRAQIAAIAAPTPQTKPTQTQLQLALEALAPLEKLFTQAEEQGLLTRANVDCQISTSDLRKSAYAASDIRAQLNTTPPEAPVQTPITEEMHVAAVKVLLRANGLDGLPQRMLDAMLAAQPAAQPAPVQT